MFSKKSIKCSRIAHPPLKIVTVTNPCYDFGQLPKLLSSTLTKGDGSDEISINDEVTMSTSPQSPLSVTNYTEDPPEVFGTVNTKSWLN